MSNSLKGDWQVAAIAANEPEADLIRQRLEELGIGAISQRAIGGPEMGLAGARYIYVHARDLERARTLLGR
jgi:Putative prokaryotic signal transducing protein